MKQFWTPLARMLGMVEPVKTTASSIDANQHATQPQAHLSQWPLLFTALRQEAEQVWCAKNLKHTEVNPDEILAITGVSLQAGNPAMDAQLRSWHAETDDAHLIQWMVNGPFNTELIRAHVNFDALVSLRVVDRPHEPTEQAPSAYSPAGYQATQAVLHISTESSWVPRPPAPETPPDCQALEIVIRDALGERRVQVHHPLVIVGTRVMQDSSAVEEANAPPVTDLVWQGESAQFIHIQAVHASGCHLMLRAHAQGFAIEDMGSTNGTFLNGEKLPVGQTVASVLPLSLGLGGPTTDPTDLTACVQISIDGMPRHKPHNPTPLRRIKVDEPSTSHTKAPSAVLTLLVMDGAKEMRIAVPAFPFEIGRDPDADWTIPAEHVMVSRRHLVLQSFDAATQRVAILDVSRHGLTASPEGFSQPPKSGTWVEHGQTLILGRIDQHAGISLRVQCESSPAAHL